MTTAEFVERAGSLAEGIKSNAALGFSLEHPELKRELVDAAEKVLAGLDVPLAGERLSISEAWRQAARLERVVAKLAWLAAPTYEPSNAGYRLAKVRSVLEAELGDAEDPAGSCSLTD